MISFCYKMLKLIYLAIVVAQFFLPAPAQSGGVTLKMEADLIKWEAYLADGSSKLPNENNAGMLSTYLDRMNFFSPVFAEDLEWPSLIGSDWGTYNFEGIEDTFRPYPKDRFTLTQADDEGFTDVLSSFQHVPFDLGLSMEEWDHFTYDFGSVPVKNTIPMPAAILLICFGLIGLAGFARKRSEE